MSPERWRQIESLYHAALERGPDRRGAYLAEACSGDAGLRSEVEALLDKGGELDSLLEKPSPDRQRFGPYTTVEKLGAGGMGEVYKAFDKRLNRTVAIKVLKARFSDRFLREARAIAALNHPGICTLYDVGEDYLVMELVDGKPLSGPLPLDQTLLRAEQICDALDAAHRAGIVHRDLKPSNILVTKQGIKLLDFGIARMMSGEETQTAAGCVIGTPAYMAPEVLKGQLADVRSDIYSLGCVLHEIATGARPGPRALEPPGLERVVRTCLAEDPDDRWQSAREVKLAIEMVRQPASALRKERPWIWPAVAGLCLASALAFGWLWLLQPIPATQSMQFMVDPPPGMLFVRPIATAVSPDSRFLVFAAGSSLANPSLWLRPMDSLTARLLPGTEGGTLPFWSPDSKSLAFFSEGKLKRIEIVDGALRVLCDADVSIGPMGGTWSRDGVILFGSPQGLRRVPASGGAPVLLTHTDASRGVLAHGFPQFLPKGKSFLYFISSAGADMQGIYAGSLEQPEKRVRIVGGSTKAIYAAPHGGRLGHLLWLRERTLLAQPFNPGTLRLEGDPKPVAEGVAVISAVVGSHANFWVSDAGLLVHRGQVSIPKSKIVWMSREGNRLGEVAPEDQYGSCRLAPDGLRVALERYDASGNLDVWLFEFGRAVMTRLTLNATRDGSPAWSSDGRQVAFSSDRVGGVLQLYRKNSGGGGQEEQLTEGPNTKFDLDWSRDGRYLLYTEAAPKTQQDIWAVPLAGDRKPIAVVQSTFNERGGQLSPDGKWIAYDSDESGRFEVYVQAFPIANGKWQISNQGGKRSRWRNDGRELFYLDPSGKVMAAAIVATPNGVKSSSPAALFTLSPVPIFYSSYDVTADGQRFLILEQSGTAAVRPLSIVSNWQARLKQ